MSKITRKLDFLKVKLERFEKKNAELRTKLDKRKARLDGSQNALQVAEQTIGNKLVAKKRNAIRGR